MGSEQSNILIYEGFGETEKDALQSLKSMIQYKYQCGNNFESDSAYIYGGLKIQIKFDRRNGIHRAYINLR